MRLLPLAPAALALGLLLTALPVQAHEHTCITGNTATGLTGDDAACPASADLDVVVGWLREPAVVGQINGLDLGIHNLKTDTWVENVTTVTAQYEYGGQVKQLALSGQDDRPGWYTDAIIPTKEGQFTVRVGGSASGHATQFTVQPEAVAPASDLQFPVKDPTPGDLNDRLTALEQKVDAMKTSAQQGGVNVTPGNGTPTNKTPGFEPLLLMVASGVAVALVRRRARA